MPWLADRLRRIARGVAGIADPVILMYHRVADTKPDPWGLAVSPERFAEQMRMLSQFRRPVPLDRMVTQLLAGRPEAGTVAITFDDAYLDVLRNARPILAALDIPATVFVVAGALGDPRGFWWDRLAAALLGHGATGVAPQFPFLSADKQARFAAKWHQGDDHGAHLALWGAIRTLPAEARDRAVGTVVAALGDGAGSAAPVMRAEDLAVLTEGGLIDLGVHTMTHPSLPSLDAAAQRAEIGGCRDALERITGTSIRRLAYPFGDYDHQSLAAARDLGFDYAVSVEAGLVRDAGARYRLPRHDVKNWTGAEFARRLRWWI